MREEGSSAQHTASLLLSDLHSHTAHYLNGTEVSAEENEARIRMKAQNKPNPPHSVGFSLTLEHRFANTKSSQLLKDNSPWHFIFLTFEQEE